MPLGSPTEFIQWAAKIIPSQTAFILIGLVVFAAASLVLGWIRNFSPWTTVAVALLIVVFGIVVSSLSAFASSAHVRGVGGFLAWALAVLFVAVLGLIVTSVFFGVPQAGARIVSRILGTYEPLTNLPSSQRAIEIPTGQTASLSNLDPTLREEPRETELGARLQALAARAPLEIRGTLTLSPGEKRVLSVSTLRLDGGTILTNGADLTIEVNNLISDNGSIKAVDNPSAPRPNAAGSDAGRVILIVHGSISGRLSADMRGQKGADGGPGGDGAKGSKGARGDNAASGLLDCQRGAGRGGNGSPGQPGSVGGDGLAGGRGGLLIVQAANLNAARRVIGEPTAAGGPGGNGGAGGKGGPGGDGGDGGSPVGLCSGGGPTGAQGPPGPGGSPGKPGPTGMPGEIRFEPLPSA